MTRENTKLVSELCSKITGMEMTGYGKHAVVIGRNSAVKMLLANDRRERAAAKLGKSRLLVKLSSLTALFG